MVCVCVLQRIGGGGRPALWWASKAGRLPSCKPLPLSQHAGTRFQEFGLTNETKQHQIVGREKAPCAHLKQDAHASRRAALHRQPAEGLGHGAGACPICTQAGRQVAPMTAGGDELVGKVGGRDGNAWLRQLP